METLIKMEINPEDIIKAVKKMTKETISNADIIPLMKPKEVIKVEAIPKLGTGKTDLNRAKKMALEICGIWPVKNIKCSIFDREFLLF